jgi:hypothetical protein
MLRLREGTCSHAPARTSKAACPWSIQLPAATTLLPKTSPPTTRSYLRFAQREICDKHPPLASDTSRTLPPHDQAVRSLVSTQRHPSSLTPANHHPHPRCLAICSNMAIPRHPRDLATYLDLVSHPPPHLLYPTTCPRLLLSTIREMSGCCPFAPSTHRATTRPSLPRGRWNQGFPGTIGPT